MAMRIGVGLDVSKDKVDVAFSNGDVKRTIENSEAGMRQLLRALDGQPIERVVVEATGGYERLVLRSVFNAGHPIIRIQPTQFKHFARMSLQRAKTDTIDAELLAQMGLIGLKTPLWEAPPEHVEELRDLVRRRGQMVRMIDDERRREKQAEPGFVQETIRRHIAWMKKEKQAVEAEIDALVKKTGDLKEVVDTLEDVKGVGTVTATTLACRLPELGTHGRAQIAALVGVAPMNSDSGRKSNPRAIKGGRSDVRKVLYMAALSATRHNPHIREYYLHLLHRGKVKKVALVAVMRKLLTHLNSLMSAFYLEKAQGTRPAAAAAAR